MKNKILLRMLTALLLVAMLLLTVTACASSQSKVPDGMQIATAYGAKYRLYVPTTWSVSIQPGVSGAYYNLVRQSTVSVAEYPIDDETNALLQGATASGRLKAYFNSVLLPQVKLMITGEVHMYEEDCIATLLGDANAQQMHYSATVSGEVLHFLQIIAEKNGSFYVFSYTAREDFYKMCLTDVQKMLKEFLFADAYLPVDPTKEIEADANAPEGMQLASNKDVAYSFYVPTSWQINVTEKVYAARAKDGSSVSVIPYVPSAEGITIEEYFAKTEEMMGKTSGGKYECISKQNGKLGGGDALVCEYKYTVGGTTYQYLQVIAGYKGMIYNLTYTALPENFETNRADVNAIIDAFAFR